MNPHDQPQKQSGSSSFKNGDISGIENAFGFIGAVIRSLAFSLAGMLFFMAYRYFEVQTLFAANFPEHMQGYSRGIASNLIAVVFIIPTLLFISNADKLKNIFVIGHYKGVTPAVAMAWITFFINLFFWQAWKGSPDLLFKVAISVITAYFDYTFAELFNKKFADWQRNSKAYQSLYGLEQKLIGVKTDINEALRKLNGYKQKATEMQAELTKLEGFIIKRRQLLERFSCPYCFDYVGETQNGLNKHLGTCKTRHHEKTAA